VAERGHRVTLFEKEGEIGGQFLLAANIPGKEEFNETLRYFKEQLKKLQVEVRLETEPAVETLSGFDEIVIATGVRPRELSIEGSDHPKVVSYPKLISGQQEAGKTVAVIGAGGIGFDAAAYLLHAPGSRPDPNLFMAEWGIDRSYRSGGGICAPAEADPLRQIYLLQRKATKPGATLGKTTGWIHRSVLKRNRVKFLVGVRYLSIDDHGLKIEREGETETLEVDTIVVCAGQESLIELASRLDEAEIGYHLIGGARRAAEVDAKRAIFEAFELADAL
jgi:2,4-dienoyl-CoA reductase (NADPH2)